MTEAFLNSGGRLLGVLSPFCVLALPRHSAFTLVIATDPRISKQFPSIYVLGERLLCALEACSTIILEYVRGHTSTLSDHRQEEVGHVS